MIYLQLFLSFLQVGMFSIGGGYAAVPLIRDQAVVVRQWLTMAEFTDLMTIAEMTPGPIAINSATFIGMRVAGVPGALMATFANIVPSCVIVSLLAYLYTRYRKMNTLQSVLACLRATVVALIAAAGVSVLRLAIVTDGKFDIAAILLFAAGLFVLRWKKPNPIIVMVSCGVIYTAVGLILGIG